MRRGLARPARLALALWVLLVPAASAGAEGALLLSSRVTPAAQVHHGDELTYTLSVRNVSATALTVTLHETLADGVQLTEAAAEPSGPGTSTSGGPDDGPRSVADGSALVWTGFTLAPGAQRTLTYRARVAAYAARPLTSRSRAVGRDDGGAVRGTAASGTRATLDQAGFDLGGGVLVGRVYLDADGDARFRPEVDRPLAKVRLLLPNGRQVLTDASGRYGFPGVPAGETAVLVDPASVDAVPAWQLGSLSPYRLRVGVHGVTVLDVPMVAAAGAADGATGPGPEGDAEVAQTLPDEPPDGGLTIGHGRFQATLGAAGLTVDAAAQAYVQVPYAAGELEVALDARLDGGGDPAGRGLRHGPPPATSERFPELGSGTAARLPLTSQDGVAFRYTEDGFSLAYLHGPLAAPAVGSGGAATTFRFRFEPSEAFRTEAFFGLAPSRQVEDVLRPDGTRHYPLSRLPAGGTAQVLVRTLDADGGTGGEVVLVAGRDYVLDVSTGAITLARPLWLRDAAGRPQRLVVRYAPKDAPRTQPVVGAGVRYDDGALSAAAGVARVVDKKGPQTRLGVEAGYRGKGFGVGAGYLWRADAADGMRGVLSARGHAEGDGWGVEGKARYGSTVTFGVEGRYASPVEPWSLEGGLERASGGTWSGTGRLAYALDGDVGGFALEHASTELRDLSVVLFERDLGPVRTSVGFGYDWRGPGFDVIGRAGAERERLSLGVQHNQSLGAHRSSTDATVTYRLDPEVDAEGTLSLDWGAGARGQVGLVRRVGDGELSVRYRLPDGTQKGNRLRFGVDAPLALSPHVSVDLAAGYERGLADGSHRTAASTALRYRAEGIDLSVAPELTITNGKAKLRTKAGFSGTIDGLSTLRADADYQLAPVVKGKFSAAYGYRGADLTVLGTASLTTGATTVLAGETSAGVTVGAGVQLHPSFAYRLRPGDPGAATLQAGFGGTAFLVPAFGVGAHAAYRWQPAGGAGAMLWNLEGTARVLDGTFLSLGYGFGDGAGLTELTRGGLYLRMDLYGGTP